MRLTVIGTGYLGAVHAACMAELGFEVLGIDVDTAKIEQLASGRAPFHEPGLDELLARHVASGRLRFGTSFAEAAEFGDVHFVCVGTPQADGAPDADMQYVDASFGELARHLTRPTLVVGKSTVPVGTAARLEAMLQDTAPARRDVRLVWNPEFLREGFAVQDTLTPDRIVIGVSDDGHGPADEAQMRKVYATQVAAGVPFLTVGYSTAELVKGAANAFLATKISFINAMSEICDATGGDVVELAEAIGHDVRIGKEFLRAGVGFGGGCLPKDIRAFSARAEELGLGDTFAFLREVDHVNDRQRDRVVRLAHELTGGLAGARVAVLGVAFKPDSDDIRESPALHVAHAAHAAGAHVTVYDPKAGENAARAFPELSYASGTEAACTDADLVVLLTEWREFRELDPSWLHKVVAQPTIIDARNALDPKAWRDAGWTYRAIGRP